MAVITWLRNVFEGKKRQSDDRKLYKKIDEQLVFAKSAPLTIGVEFELALLDAKTLRPANMAATVISKTGSPQVKKESFEHMVEVTSTIGATVHETETQLKKELEKLTPVCRQHDVLLTGTGYPPTIRLADCKQVSDKRYARLCDERKIMNQRFGTLGMHIHLGMSDSEQCIRFHNFFMHFMPHLIALSASSPFENGVETGLASIRPTITESLPVAGMPYSYHNWHEYVSLCRAIYRAGSIQNLKDLWWDLRPSPRFGTLEIRICDQPADLAEGMAVAAFVHGVAAWFREHQNWLDEIPRPNAWRMRENKWRAIRYGLKADLVLNNQGETRPIRDDIELWMDRILPFVEQYNYKSHMDVLDKIMAQGNSAERQQRLWANTHDLDLVARFNCDEFAAQVPLWDRVAAYAQNETKALAG
jgi:carboxylate-amine ligase